MPHCQMLIGGLLLTGLPLLAWAGPPRSYDVYQPAVAWHTIHEGKQAPGHFAYNHMASVEWFNGQFYCVWGGHSETYKEGVAGQVVLLSTSRDFVHWTPPVNFVAELAENPVADAQGKQWQPNLLNYQGRELWCTWYFSSDNRQLSGTYVSRLAKQPAAKWVNQLIFQRQIVDGRSCVGFASQNPVLLESGRVLAPVTLYCREGEKTFRWNACLSTDDDGASWQCSNPISSLEDASAQWEPFFYQQADGRLRALMRNFTSAIAAPDQWRLTTTGTGGAKGEPVVFDSDPRFSFMETANCRPQVFSVHGRYCLLQQDALVNHRDYFSRYNVALCFSRTGADDFVAGPPISRPDVISAYPQGVEHDGRIYVAYSSGTGREPRSIEGAVVNPAPRSDRFYVWPRSKEIVNLGLVANQRGVPQNTRVNPGERTKLPVMATVEGRRALRFSGRASAGVDIDPVDFAAGEKLELRFEAKILRLQERGNLVFCSLGDSIPIRVGMPANRPGTLYAFGRQQWTRAGEFPLSRWLPVTITFGDAAFSVKVGDAQSQTFSNPLVTPNRRLYLGDGYEVDYMPSNAGSEFLIDIDTLRTQVVTR